MSEGRRSGPLGFLFRNADAILAFAKVALPSSFTGALVGWATWFAGLFQQYAPASWIFAGVIGALIGAVVAFLAILTRERMQLLRFRSYVFSAGQINPLDRLFTSKRLKLVDLSPPVGPFIDNKTFIDCEIIGPGNAMFQDCHFQQNAGEVVDAIIIKPGLFPRNGFGFRNCTFTRCRFYLITFMVPEPDFEAFYKHHSGLNWITERPDEPVLPMRQIDVIPEAAEPTRQKV